MYYDEDLDRDIDNNDYREQHLSNLERNALELEKAYRYSASASSNRATGIMIVGSLLIQLCALIVIIITNLIFISLKQRRNYVQLMDGQIIEVSEVNLKYRTPQAIRRFVFDTLSLMFNWNGFKPASNLEEFNNPELDSGVSLEKGIVPTTTYYASFAFREGLRTNLLNQIAQIVPRELISEKSRSAQTQEKSSNVSELGSVKRESPKVQTVIVIDFISNPRQLQRGKWEVDVVSTILEIRSGRNAQEISKFNKRLVIVAVEPLTPSITQELAYYQPLVNIRSSGLQIVEIKELEI